MGSVPPAGIPSGELLWCPPPTLSPDMDTLAVSLVDLWYTPGVQEKIEESARVFFSNSILTVNLIPALLVGALLLFLLPFLLGLPILNGLGGGGGSASYGSNLEVSDGYGAPSSSYGAPEASYGAPEPSYGAPEPSYGAPAPSYDAPASNSYDAPVSNSYDTPSSGYDAGRRKRSVELPAEAGDLYSDLNLANNHFDVSGPHLSVKHAFVPAASPLAGSLPLLN